MPKKSVKKKAHYAHSHHHHTQSNNMLIIVAGGFMVIVILIYMIGNTKNLFGNNVSATEVVVEEVVSDNVVTIANNAYSPATLTVNAGDSVDFVNNDTVAHTATSDNGSFDTGNIAPGESKVITFDTPGTYMYYCTYHPNMTGTIVVK